METRTISTTFVNASYWKCLRLWYHIRVKRKPSSDSTFLHKLEVFSVNSNNDLRTTLWSTSHTTDRWTYVQLPLISDKDNVIRVSSPNRDVRLVCFTVQWLIIYVQLLLTLQLFSISANCNFNTATLTSHNIYQRNKT